MEQNFKNRVSTSKKRPLKQHENVSVFFKKQSLYNPQGLKRYGKINKRGSMGDNWAEMGKNEYVQEYTNYPTQIVKVSSEGKTVHSTQKPVALLEYLIKTYTNENDLVLDFTMGSGTTGVACKNLNRNFIGIELDEKYFNIAKERIR